MWTISNTKSHKIWGPPTTRISLRRKPSVMAMFMFTSPWMEPSVEGLRSSIRQAMGGNAERSKKHAFKNLQDMHCHWRVSNQKGRQPNSWVQPATLPVTGGLCWMSNPPQAWCSSLPQCHFPTWDLDCSPILKPSRHLRDWQQTKCRSLWWILSTIAKYVSTVDTRGVSVCSSEMPTNTCKRAVLTFDRTVLAAEDTSKIWNSKRNHCWSLRKSNLKSSKHSTWTTLQCHRCLLSDHSLSRASLSAPIRPFTSEMAENPRTHGSRRHPLAITASPPPVRLAFLANCQRIVSINCRNEDLIDRQNYNLQWNECVENNSGNHQKQKVTADSVSSKYVGM